MQSLQIFENDSWNVRTCISNEVAYFCAKDVAKALDYKNPREAIRDHVFEDDRLKLEDLRGSVGGPPLTFNERTSVYITEAGVYALIFGSHKEEAKVFKRWICQDVLPKLRRFYQEQGRMPLALQNETDLHYSLVKAIRRLYPHVLMCAGLGELQDTSEKRIDAYCKGYQAGTPDILILNLHKKFSGLAIELKNPRGTGCIADKQLDRLESYRQAGFKTLAVDDFSVALQEVFQYFQHIRIGCPHCRGKFKSQDSLANHLRVFHRIS